MPRGQTLNETIHKNFQSDEMCPLAQKSWGTEGYHFVIEDHL